MLVLTAKDLDGLGVGWPDVVDALEAAFAEKAEGLVQNPPKPGLHPRPDAFINAMPAYLGGSDRVGIKWVSGYEGNRTKGLPYIYGVFILTDADTGRPLALIDGGWITEMRTAGVSGVVLRHVGSTSKIAAIVGCGVQGRRHLEVILAERPEIEEIRAFDRSADAAEALLAGARTARTLVARTTEEALEGADLVVSAVTVTIDAGSKLRAGAASSDAVWLPVDYDDAIDPDVPNGASLFTIDDLAQYRSVSDQHFGAFPEPNGELAQVVSGVLPVPETGRRVFLNMGIAMDDVALGALVYERALAGGVGRQIDFP